jgi:FtsP/CotA-like multicopper oxidase with cupredoxin domain
MELRRRELLKLGLFGSAALALPAERVARADLAVANRMPQSRLPAPFTVRCPRLPVATPVRSSPTLDVYDIAQQSERAEILPGLSTEVWRYNDGAASVCTIVARQGTPAIVRQRNNLPGLHPTLRYKPWTSTHLHGSASLPQFDGYASDITNPGEYKDYRYPNSQPARTLWYHDHGVHITAPNAYMGLAAFYILHDAQELSLPIPHGDYDVPLVVKDAMFTTSGQLIFDDNGESGLFGDVITVNGKPWPVFEVERRRYRFRLLNASISRSYGLELSTGEPFTVIGTDGGLMPAPQDVGHIRFGMAERYEVVIDFSKHAIGDQIVLRNVSPDNNIDYATTRQIMAFKVVADATVPDQPVPSELNPANEVMQLTPTAATPVRQMNFKRDGGLWSVNGRTWLDVINSGFKQVIANPKLDAVEVWELRNDSGGWFHPVHIHLVDFKILSRNGRPPQPYERGPKDVAYVGEGETVRVIARFGPHTGRYMMHCHNLVHEDHDMMVQFEVGSGGDDPRGTPAQPQPAGPLPVA